MRVVQPGEVAPDYDHERFVAALDAELVELRNMLIEKNLSYGNSAADPIRIFSKASPLEQIDVRIDDKLSRLARGHEYVGDDTPRDLVGYLILRGVVRRLT